jgi:hypothetical protein
MPSKILVENSKNFMPPCTPEGGFVPGFLVYSLSTFNFCLLSYSLIFCIFDILLPGEREDD